MLEVIVQNAEDAKRAEQYGVDRLEIVQAIGEGGLTPSYGTIKNIIKSVSTKTMIMIRPHSYSFTYSPSDQKTMLTDIEIVKELGATGIVFGALTKEGDIDQALLEKVIDKKGSLALTFHRALESTRDIEESYQLLRKNYGTEITQLLTSGGTEKAIDSLPRLKRWIKDSEANQDSFKILVGSGVSTKNVQELHSELANEWYHVGSGARIANDFSQTIDKTKIAFFKQNT
ncbi:copper homeostasis protein CutC [Listeria sp. PSOL-1]|uniref:copper homeostasis protein CutC n=1 Tax=Listeria sp. PSOL-1 TaxID=1844999 RepID=UPI0013D7E9D5|nr:copper homeostasis protein CutC [Listeria sp. PSOL-1]